MFQRSFILNSGLFWRKPKGRWGCFSGANCFLFEFFVYLQKMVCIFFEKHIPEWWVQIIPMQIDPTSTECRGGNVPIQTRPIMEMCTWKQNERTVRPSLQSEGIPLLEKWITGRFVCRLCWLSLGWWFLSQVNLYEEIQDHLFCWYLNIRKLYIFPCDMCVCVCVFKFMLVFCCMSFGGNAWIQVSTMFAPPSRGFRSDGGWRSPKKLRKFPINIPFFSGICNKSF